MQECRAVRFRDDGFGHCDLSLKFHAKMDAELGMRCNRLVLLMFL